MGAFPLGLPSVISERGLSDGSVDDLVSPVLKATVPREGCSVFLEEQVRWRVRPLPSPARTCSGPQPQLLKTPLLPAPDRTLLPRPEGDSYVLNSL